MTENTRASLEDQVSQLIAHIRTENPELLEVVHGYRRLDRIAYKVGLLDRTESYATKIAWWPLISVLGTYSSGKSTFINHLLGQQLQKTGNQAVDDKFTVICYGPEDTPRVLPGIALDSDPRFPFYRISHEIEKAIEGEGVRLDTYLQLKTSNSERLRGKIIIDSPGFDADDQRTSTLRITDHIIDLSDLVLVFFDARHPEPGAMRDTLEYLVAGTLQRPDFNKFMHILNQIDNAAREDNPEEVFAAWQRALAQQGLTAGRFYRIYDPAAAAPIENEHLKQRFEAKRDEDMSEIERRIEELEVERSYRVTGKLEQTAKAVRDLCVPRLREARRAWRRRTWWLDGLVFGTSLVLLLGISIGMGYWNGLRFRPPWLQALMDTPVLFWLLLAVLVLVAVLVHRALRNSAARHVLKTLRRDSGLGDHHDSIVRAFEVNARSWWPFFFTKPRGWNPLTRRKLDRILSDAHRGIQALNDRYTDPSGRRAGAAVARSAAEQPPADDSAEAEPAAAQPWGQRPAAAEGDGSRYPRH